MLSQLLVAAMVARHLGASGYGILGAAIAWSTMLYPVAQIGLKRVLVTEIISTPQSIITTINRVLSLQAVASVGIFLGYALFRYLSSPGSDENSIFALACILTAFHLFSAPIEFGRHVFESQARFDLIARANLAGIALGSVSRLSGIGMDMGVLWFAGTFAAQSVATSIVVSLSSLGKIKALAFRRNEDRDISPSRKSLFRRGIPLVLSSVSVAAYMNVDLLMIKSIMGESEAGIYSVAVRMSAAMYFVPEIVTGLLLPGIVNAMRTGGHEERKEIESAMRTSTLCAYLTLLAALVFSSTLIQLLFGDEFEKSVGIFKIHAWSLLFVFLGSMRGKYLVALKREKVIFVATATGLVTNILLNLVFIPNLGSSGAAIATNMSAFVAGVLTTFFYDDLRGLGMIQIKSIVFPFPKISSIVVKLRQRW